MYTIHTGCGEYQIELHICKCVYICICICFVFVNAIFVCAGTGKAEKEFDYNTSPATSPPQMNRTTVGGSSPGLGTTNIVRSPSVFTSHDDSAVKVNISNLQSTVTGNNRRINPSTRPGGGSGSRKPSISANSTVGDIPSPASRATTVPASNSPIALFALPSPTVTSSVSFSAQCHPLPPSQQPYAPSLPPIHKGSAPSTPTTVTEPQMYTTLSNNRTASVSATPQQAKNRI